MGVARGRMRVGIGSIVAALVVAACNGDTGAASNGPNDPEPSGPIGPEDMSDASLSETSTADTSTETTASATVADTTETSPSAGPMATPLDGGIQSASGGDANSGGASNVLPPMPTGTAAGTPTSCPPCQTPPFPNCIGTGTCGCGPYVCPDTPAGAGGASGGGGAGGDESELPADGVSCRTTADCDDPNLFLPECFSPGDGAEVPPPGCGAPDWCGDCECSPKPAGLDTECSLDADCPGYIDPYSTEEVPLTYCDTATALCQGCFDDADCSGDTPHCVEVPESYFRAFKRCGGCEGDADCPAERPHCVDLAVYDMPPGTRECQECVSNSDCAVGVCSGGRCTPGCEPTDDGCSPIETRQCNPDTLRCERRTCDDATGCSANVDCASGLCARRACQSDASCDTGGHCVNGYCYDEFGHCEDTYYPLAP